MIVVKENVTSSGEIEKVRPKIEDYAHPINKKARGKEIGYGIMFGYNRLPELSQLFFAHIVKVKI